MFSKNILQLKPNKITENNEINKLQVNSVYSVHRFTYLTSKTE